MTKPGHGSFFSARNPPVPSVDSLQFVLGLLLATARRHNEGQKRNILNWTRTRRLQWAGHDRRNRNPLVRVITEGNPGNKRSSGTPSFRMRRGAELPNGSGQSGKFSAGRIGESVVRSWWPITPRRRRTLALVYGLCCRRRAAVSERTRHRM